MEFIKKKEKEPMIYMLGCLPFIQRPYDKYANVLTCGIGTHACIYTSSVIEQTLQENAKDIIDWDYYTFRTYTRYTHHEPLCYQLFPETENQNHWESFFGLKYILLYIINLLQLDKKPEPGYTFFYNASKVLYALISIFVVLFSLLIVHIIYVYALKNYNIAKNIKKK
jgi:hypothetical protein